MMKVCSLVNHWKFSAKSLESKDDAEVAEEVEAEERDWSELNALK